MGIHISGDNMFKKLKKIINDITEQPPKECWVCGDEHIISRGIRFEPYCPDWGSYLITKK